MRSRMCVADNERLHCLPWKAPDPNLRSAHLGSYPQAVVHVHVRQSTLDKTTCLAFLSILHTIVVERTMCAWSQCVYAQGEKVAFLPAMVGLIGHSPNDPHRSVERMCISCVGFLSDHYSDIFSVHYRVQHARGLYIRQRFWRAVHRLGCRETFEQQPRLYSSTHVQPEM